MSDTAETIHRVLYGKSGRANANAGNEALEFGFDIGKDSGDDSAADILLAHGLCGFPQGPESSRWSEFCEWKRGYWSARLQRAFAKAKGGADE